MHSLLWAARVVLFYIFLATTSTSTNGSSHGGRGGIEARANRRRAMDQKLKAQVEEMLASFERDADVALLTQQQTSCSCYRIRNDYCCHQHLCICSPMCWNGHEMISLGQPKCAPATENAPPQPGQKAVLTPLDCEQQQDEFKQGLESIITLESVEEPLRVREAGEGGSGGKGWLESRDAVDWRFGLTLLQRFSRSSSNLAHFMGKVLPLLLVNNFTAPAALQPTVARFMLPRFQSTLERMRAAGSGAVLARLLQAMVEFALTPVLSPHIHTSEELHEHRTLGDSPMAFGLVEFESAWNAATEERPLCFERVLIPGIFKGQSYPSHPSQATFLHRHLRIKLQTQPPSKVVWGPDGVKGWAPKVLYLTRRGSDLKLRRALVPESHEALLKLMDGMGFQVTMAEFGELSFSQQFEAIQSADIVISLHGAALANVPLFARRSTILMELMPYGMYHEVFYGWSLNSGMPYFMKMCRKGSQQEGHLPEFDGVSSYDCMKKHLACKTHYVHVRQIELSDTDLQELRTMLLAAKDIVGVGLGGFGRVVQPDELPGWAEERFGNLCVAKDVQLYGVRSDFVRVPMVGNTAKDFVCVFSRDA